MRGPVSKDKGSSDRETVAEDTDVHVCILTHTCTCAHTNTHAHHIVLHNVQYFLSLSMSLVCVIAFDFLQRCN